MTKNRYYQIGFEIGANMERQKIKEYILKRLESLDKTYPDSAIIAKYELNKLLDTIR